MKFIFSENIPDAYRGSYVSYRFEESKAEGLNYIDVREFVHRNQEGFLSSMDDWHGKVCAKGEVLVDNWWLSSASRQLSWYPAVFQSFFFAVAICELIKKPGFCGNTLLVLQAPPELAVYLKEMFPNSVFKGVSSEVFPGFFFKERVKVYLSFLVTHFRLSSFRKAPNTQGDLVIFSQVLNEDKLLNYYDHFFGDLFFKADVCRRKKIHWLMLYPANKSQVKKRLKTAFETHGTSISFTNDFLGVFDLLKITIHSLKHQLQMRKLCKKLEPFGVFNHQSSVFPKFYQRKVLLRGQEILTELEVAFAIRKMARLHKFKKLIYPFEERSIERAVLLNTPEMVQTLGFAHAAMHEGHICFNIRKPPGSNSPRPDKILVTGEAPKRWFLDKGFSEESLEKIGSPRASLRVLPKASSDKGELKILVMVSHPHELQILSSLVQKNASVLRKFEVTIRKYPYSGIDEQNRWIKNLSQLVPKLRDEGGDLARQIQAHDVVMFSASSGGIEAILLGAVGLYVSLDKLMCLNPIALLKGQTDILQAFSIDELNAGLNYLSSLSKREFLELQKRQALDARKIYEEGNIDSLFD